VEVVIHKVKLSNSPKIGKYVREKIGKIINKIGENRNFHTLQNMKKPTTKTYGSGSEFVTISSHFILTL